MLDASGWARSGSRLDEVIPARLNIVTLGARDYFADPEENYWEVVYLGAAPRIAEAGG